MNLENLIPEDFNGAILVRKDNKEILKKSFGLRDLANSIPNEVNTKFATASAGKVFVAVAILQLIEKGELNFGDTIGKLLPGIDWGKIDKNITVEQLLNHTSGIPDYFDEEVMDDYTLLWESLPNYKVRVNRDLLQLFINKEMMYPTGEKFKYNNTGFIVLGIIIEELTKMPFDIYLKNNVFNPCDMKDTGYYELDRLPKNCANNYILDEEKNEFYTNIYGVEVKGTATGGAFTTVLDIEKFWDNLLKGSLVSLAMLEKMISTQASDDEDKYGYGIWLTDSGEPFFQGHDPGVSFFTYFNRKTNLMVVLVSNFCDDVWEVAEKILDEF